nr:hypothetical protein [Tanacetum cinerariifolium]
MNCTLYYSDENYGLLYTATTTTATITTVGDIILAQALKEIKSTKPKEKGNVIQELGESTTIESSQQSHDKGKEILMEPVIEFMKPIKRKYQIRLDKEVALKLQVAFDEEERLAREKAKKHPSGVDEALKKKLDDFEEEYQVSGRIVGIKSLLDAVRITVAHVCINAAQLDLVLRINFK